MRMASALQASGESQPEVTLDNIEKVSMTTKTKGEVDDAVAPVRTQIKLL